MSVRLASAALALGLGLAGVGVAAAPSLAADVASPVRLAIAVPITVPGTNTGILDAETLTQYTGPLGLLTRQLDAVIDRPVAIAVDPMIIASIRLLGNTAPASALSWLDRLGHAGNETFALSYADADLTLGIQAGGGVLQPTGFDFAIDPARFAPVSTATPTPTPTPSPTPPPSTLPPLPTTESLLDLPFSLSGIAWPKDDSVVGTDLTALAAAGYSATILSSTNLNRDADDSTVATVGEQRVLVSDAAVSDAFRAAVHSLTIDGWQGASGTLTEAIASIGRVQSGAQATVFATLDRSTLLGGSRLTDTLDALQANPAITFVALSDALAVAPTEATVKDEPQSSDRLNAATHLLAASNAETSFATVAEDPQAILDERRLALLAVLSNQWDVDADGWSAVVEAFLSDSHDLRSAVHLVTSDDFLLAADFDQFLPITVSNKLDQPVTVYVTVRPSTGALVVADSHVELSLDANSQAKVNVPVRSLSNGLVGVQVSLSSASGVSIGTPILSKVNVQAGWETPIVVIVASLVVLVFVVGIVRTVLRRRKARG